MSLESYRDRIDAIDEEISRLLGERFEVCREVARYKAEHTILMMQSSRVEVVRDGYLRRAGELDVPIDFAAALFELMIDATCRMEDELIASRQGR